MSRFFGDTHATTVASTATVRLTRLSNFINTLIGEQAPHKTRSA
jgi:hypothetical protein